MTPTLSAVTKPQLDRKDSRNDRRDDRRDNRDNRDNKKDDDDNAPDRALFGAQRGVESSVIPVSLK